MEEIELSVMSYDYSVSDLEAVLQEFEARHHVRVRIVQLSWETSWTEVMKYALHGHGPAVSEIGSTWIATLATMNALRPFSYAEVSALGGSAAFLPAMWRSGLLLDDPTIWAIPWLADARVIHYRRHWLKAVGVDESTAFQTQARLEHTLERLQASGVSFPWAVPTQPTLNTVHNITSWVWGAGGNFVDDRRQQVAFAQAEARAGIRAYYSLYRFLPLHSHPIGPAQADVLFSEGRAAVTLTGPWLMLTQSLPPNPELAADVGAALPPGVPFVSGSHLVVWCSVAPRQERLAVELARFLTSKQAQSQCSQQVGLLPVRLDVLDSPPFVDQPLYRVMGQALKAGRSFPAMRLWGLIEEKLSAVLGDVWANVLTAPNPDLDALIQAALDPLAERLNMTLLYNTR